MYLKAGFIRRAAPPEFRLYLYARFIGRPARPAAANRRWKAPAPERALAYCACASD